MSAAVAARRPEVVLHLAAQPFVRRSFAEPRETYEMNVDGHGQRARRRPRGRACSAVVVVTSRQVLRQPRAGPRRSWKTTRWAATTRTRTPRAAPSSPRTPTGARTSPATAARCRGRAGNVIGGGDWGEDRLIPDIMRARARARRSRSATPRRSARGSTSSTRCRATCARGAPGPTTPHRGLELRARRRRREPRALDRRPHHRALAGELPGSSTPARTRTRRASSRSTPQGAVASLGWRPRGTSRRRWSGSSSGTREPRRGGDLRAVTPGADRRLRDDGERAA